jgi:lysosomal acid phosphatase
MRKFKFNLSAILLVLTTVCSPCIQPMNADEMGQMVFAVDIIRHGDRGPIFDLPIDRHKWPQGLGELTPEGMDQEFQLGKQFRERYITQNHLLPETFDVEKIYVRASDVDRTLMSAECTLLGLYPLGTGPLTDAGAPGIPSRYQPIPIHTQPRETDDVLIPEINKGIFDAYKKYVYDSADWKERSAKEKPNFEKWGRLTGIKISDLKQLGRIGDAIHIRQIHHVPMPEGMTQADADAIVDVGEWVFAQSFKPPEVGQAAGMHLLNLIAKHLKDATKDDAKLKYVLFSAHDSTIATLMSALKAPAKERPRYSSDLSITLWKNSGGYSVKAALNGEPVNFPGAANGVSSLDKFEALAQAQDDNTPGKVGHED